DAAARQHALVCHVEQTILEAGAAQVGDKNLHDSDLGPQSAYFRNVSRTASSGRGMTWELMRSPLAVAAWAPASTAARTEPTSPRTKVVTKAPPICTWPASVTLAALHMASVAAMVAIKPLVSTRPSASLLPLFREEIAIKVTFVLVVSLKFQLSASRDA